VLSNWQIYIYGGSHAGYLGGRLIEDPDMCSLIKACVLRNPVTYLPLVYTSGVPKWAFNAFLGVKKDFTQTVRKGICNK
jgi:hypothetical protein